jgi:hypothetical protein
VDVVGSNLEDVEDKRKLLLDMTLLLLMLMVPQLKNTVLLLTMPMVLQLLMPMVPLLLMPMVLLRDLLIMMTTVLMFL